MNRHRQRKFRFRGRLMTCTEIANLVGVHRNLIDKRLRAGDDIERAARVTDRRSGVDWSIDIEQHIADNPDGMQLEEIAAVFGVTKQAIDLITQSAAAKIRRLRISDDLREHLMHAYHRAPSSWQSAWDYESDTNGVSRASPLHNMERPLSAAAAEPSELTARVDAAITRLEVAADRALLAALMPVRLQES